MPSSMARWMIRLDSAWSGLPHAPNIMAPRQSLLTLTPVRPKYVYSMGRDYAADDVYAGNWLRLLAHPDNVGRRIGASMKLSTQLNYASSFKESADSVVDLERAGIDIVWVAEAYGFDAPSQMGYLAAKTERIEIGSGILPIYSRTPTLLAQTAAGIDALSGGRMILGLGASGPQVIEGWHGVPYDKPLERTREIIDICRRAWRREVLTSDGIYQLPLPSEQGTGLGKPLKMITHPVRSAI